jgi:hypothetical protein
MYSPKTHLRIGVLYENAQMSDLVGIDVLGNMSTVIIDLICSMAPEYAHLKELAIPMEFLYISSSLEPAAMTSQMRVVPTHTYDNAPRDLE